MAAPEIALPLVESQAPSSTIDELIMPSEASEPFSEDGTPVESTEQPTNSATPLMTLECREGSSLCPELQIQGDAHQVIPGYGLSDFRGFADPSIRQDPLTGRLWMAYSYPHVEMYPEGRVVNGRRYSFNVDIHLAHSDDAGQTWLYDKELWTSESETDPGGSGKKGLSSHEVANLLPVVRDGVTTWYAVHLRYLVPEGERLIGRSNSSFTLRITQAPSPVELSTSKEAVLAGSMTSIGWQPDLYFSQLSPELDKCHIWFEPALTFENDTLYLAAVCLSWDLFTSQREFSREQVGLFATNPSGEVDTWQWRYLGKLAGPQESSELGASSLTQVDLARSRDGKLLMIASPNHVENSRINDIDVHHGCRVLQVASLDPPALFRDAQGNLQVLASITASDLEYGPGACGYDPASATGILFVRRVFDFDAPSMVWSIHTTNIHP